MKHFLTAIFLLCAIPLLSQTVPVSPLASYSKIWNDKKYSVCNTAANTSYLSKGEKEVIYILNLVRANPALFAKTVLVPYPSVSGDGYLAEDSFYFISLVNTLQTMEPLGILYPDYPCFESAKYHAVASGITGYIGHERKTRAAKLKKHYYGECCDYGHSDPLDIVLALLIDEGIPSLGHRDLLLTNYTKIGVSIQPHKKYGNNAVIDFYY
ncbi:MAG: hypothetical protein ACKOU7_03280 [Ferruginibacter sp.]